MTPLPGRTRRDSIEVVLTRVPERVFCLPAARALCSTVALLTVGCATAPARPIPESTTAAEGFLCRHEPAKAWRAAAPLPASSKAYFEHIKQALASAWDPASVLRARDPAGKLLASEDRATVVAVTLNDQGGLTEIQVARMSGVDFLDQSAVEAFRKAQPFRKPPLGLLNADGQIKFWFGFCVELGIRGAPLPKASN